jgi:O-antigen/teichoic acid export membrane protein
MDRFIIGAMLSLAAVAYYATPLEIVSKLSLVPAAIVGVLFPAFALSFVQNRAHTSLLLSRSVKFVFLIVFPLSLIIVTFAPEGLALWLGPTFVQNSMLALRWLTVGVFVNCLAQVAFALVQGIGRPEITVALILVDLPVYLAAEWWLIRHYGVTGAAAAWAARATTDAAFLFFIAGRLVPPQGYFNLRPIIAVPVSYLMFYLATIPHSIIGKGLFLAASLSTFCWISWTVLLAGEEKAVIRSPLTALRQLPDVA